MCGEWYKGKRSYGKIKIIKRVTIKGDLREKLMIYGVSQGRGFDIMKCYAGSP